MMAKRLFLDALLIVLGLTVYAIAQSFNVYVGGLPAASLPSVSTDALYVLQTPCVNTTCTSKQVPAFALLGAGQGYLIGGLPTCNGSTNVGLRVYVTNGVASPTFASAVGATGTVTDPVFCAGSGGWVYG